MAKKSISFQITAALDKISEEVLSENSDRVLDLLKIPTEPNSGGRYTDGQGVGVVDYFRNPKFSNSSGSSIDRWRKRKTRKSKKGHGYQFVNEANNYKGSSYAQFLYGDTPSSGHGSGYRSDLPHTELTTYQRKHTATGYRRRPMQLTRTRWEGFKKYAMNLMKKNMKSKVKAYENYRAKYAVQHTKDK